LSPPRIARARLPHLFGGLAVILLGLYILPVAGLIARAPWTRIGAVLADPSVGKALLLSLAVSSCAAALSLILGLPLAWTLARQEFPGRRIVRSLVVLPMVFPPVVGGLALFTVFGRRGFLGPLLDGLGVSLAFTPGAAVLAAAFVASPFFVLSAEAGFTGADRRLEEAAATLGASPWRILRTVTLPAMRPALLAGLALTWARALGEFGATIMFAGNMRGRTQTVPLAVYEMFQTGNDGGAILLSLVLIAVSIALLLLLRGRAVRP
jgi:molybdate transport system permease protein